MKINRVKFIFVRFLFLKAIMKKKVNFRDEHKEKPKQNNQDFIINIHE